MTSPRTMAAAAVRTALVICSLVVGARGSCSPGLRNSLGWTRPRGDIVVEYGRPLEIACGLDASAELVRAERLDWRSLAFQRGNETVAADDGDGGGVTLRRLNDTALLLRVERPPMSESTYYCSARTPGGAAVRVCLNHVIVGRKPEPAEGFACASENLERLVCEWRADANYLRTNYTLYFLLSARPARGIPHACPRVEVESNGLHRCTWNESSAMPYRATYAHYWFNLTATNALGVASQVLKFDHYAHVKPAPLKDLAAAETTPHSAKLTFRVPYQMLSLTPLTYELLHTSEFSDGRWTLRQIDPKPVGPQNTVILDELEHANARYDVRISYKTNKVSERRFWADNASITFRTKPERPSKPPGLAVGAFESKRVGPDRRAAYVYWRRVEPYEENGDDFAYRVISAKVDGVPTELKPDRTTSTYMTFDDFPSGQVELSIASSNAVGDSLEASSIVVPAADRVLPEPMGFTKRAFASGDRLYELLWTDDRAADAAIDNYTVFWCDHVRERPYQCEGKLEWTTAPADARATNVTTADGSKTYQFAIAANGRLSSSGMVWADCTILADRPAEKMRSVWIDRVGDSYIELAWKLECSDRGGQILGYEIEYCPITRPDAADRSCAEEPKKAWAPGGMERTRWTVQGLRPYTTYRLSVAVSTKGGAGNPSDYLYNTTAEGAPSPVAASVEVLGDDAASVAWSRPELTNGVLKFYEVRYRSSSGDDDWTRFELEKENSSTRLSNLTGYTNYTIEVRACTVVCSPVPPARRVRVRTAIGRPGSMDSPRVNFSPDSEHMVDVFWSPPTVAGGALDRYEVKVVEVFRNRENRTNVFETDGLNFSVPYKLCVEDDAVSSAYFIRAVNYDRSEDHGAAVFSGDARLNVRTPLDSKFEGKWSGESLILCIEKAKNLWWQVVLFFLLGVVMVTALGFGLKYVYQRFKFMKNIKPCLPPGLEIPFEKDAKQSGKWAAGGKDSEKSGLPAFGDGESLLTKGATDSSIDRSGICERSNCSAQTDSTAVSLTSHRDEAGKDGSEQHDEGVQSDTFSANSRRDSEGSSEPLNSSRLKLDAMEAAPYSAMGTVWPQEDSHANPMPTSHYVALGSVMPPNPIDRPLVNIAPALAPTAAASNYVRVDDPRFAAPLSMPDASAEIDQMELFSLPPNLNPKMAPEMGTNRPMIANGRIDVPFVPKVPRAAEDVAATASLQPVLSPEVYCKFGSNTNVVPRFNFMNGGGADADGEFLASLDDEPDMSYFEEPRNVGEGQTAPPPPSSHYVPFKH